MRKRSTLKSPILNIITSALPQIKDKPQKESEEKETKEIDADKIYKQYCEFNHTNTQSYKRTTSTRRNKKAYETFIRRQKSIREEEDDSTICTTNQITNMNLLKTIYPNMKVRSKIYDYMKTRDMPCSVPDEYYKKMSDVRKKLISKTLSKYIKIIDDKSLVLKDNTLYATTTCSFRKRNNKSTF